MLSSRKSVAVVVLANILLLCPACAEPAAPNLAQEAPAPGVQALIVKQAHDNGVPVDLAKAVVGIESRGNPRAVNHGALGLMQIKADTARRLGFVGAPTALLTPDTNLHYGLKYLAAAYRASGGDVCQTLAMYQSGHRVARMSHAMRTYCSRARALMART